MIMNEEATMARRGLGKFFRSRIKMWISIIISSYLACISSQIFDYTDPVSRKSKCSGKNKPGFCVYLAYQLFDNVTHNQMVGEALNQCVDMTIKRKQLLQSLTEAKIPPQIDEKIRKSIKEVCSN